MVLLGGTNKVGGKWTEGWDYIRGGGYFNSEGNCVEGNSEGRGWG